MSTSTALEHFEFTSKGGHFYRERIGEIYRIDNVYEGSLLKAVVGTKHLIPHITSSGLGISGRYTQGGGSILLPTAALVHPNALEFESDGNLYFVSFDETTGGRESATPKFSLHSLISDFDPQALEL